MSLQVVAEELGARVGDGINADSGENSGEEFDQLSSANTLNGTELI
jgi:hypothetical protein